MSSGKKAFFTIAPLLLLACVASTTVLGFADSVSDTPAVYARGAEAMYQLTATESHVRNGESLFLIQNPALANSVMAGMDIVACDQFRCNAPTAPGFISDILGVLPVTSGAQTKYYLGFMTSGADLAFTSSVIGYAIEVPGGIAIKATGF